MASICHHFSRAFHLLSLVDFSTVTDSILVPWLRLWGLSPYLSLMYREEGKMKWRERILPQGNCGSIPNIWKTILYSSFRHHPASGFRVTKLFTCSFWWFYPILCAPEIGSTVSSGKTSSVGTVKGALDSTVGSGKVYLQLVSIRYNMRQRRIMRDGIWLVSKGWAKGGWFWCSRKSIGQWGHKTLGKFYFCCYLCDLALLLYSGPSCPLQLQCWIWLSLRPLPDLTVCACQMP